MFAVGNRQSSKVTSSSNRRKFHSFTIGVTLFVAFGLLLACNMDRLGDFLMIQNQYSVAAPCYELMTAVESGCGTRSERLADAWTNLGICYAKLARESEALKAENVAVEMRKEILDRS